MKATLHDVKTKKGGWRAREDASGLVGPIVDSQKVPLTAKAGDAVKLKVANDKPEFYYVPETT